MTSLNYFILEKYDLIGFSFNGIEFENDKKKLRNAELEKYQ
jgi:hypothetical protein